MLSVEIKTTPNQFPTGSLIGHFSQLSQDSAVGFWFKMTFMILVLMALVNVCWTVPTVYRVGRGIADVTGPAAEINMVRIFHNQFKKNF